MYRRARLRLVAWYAAIFVAILVVLGVAAFFAMRRALDHETRAGVRATVDAWLAANPTLDGRAPTDLDPEFHAETADVFLLVFRADGALLANPRNLEAEEFVEAGAFARALAGESAWFTVVEHGARLLSLASPVVEGGRVTGVVIAGRSLAGRDRALTELLVVLGAAGMAGVGLSLVAGWLLAGRALGPLRLAHEQQRAFVADTSRELRSPLAVIRTSSDLLLRSALADGDREIVEGMREVAADASTLVDEMLELARLSERGRTLEHGEPVVAALDEEARTVLDQLAPLLAAKGSTVTAELAPAAGRARPEEVRRIVRALIENTVAHTPAGTALSVATERHGGRVTLVVRDTGPGVAAHDRERIFERFARVDSARTPGEHGAGLGLAIVRAIAERRGGSAVVDAAPGGGLQVSVSLPAADRRPGSAVVAPAIAGHAGGEPRGPPA